MCKLVNLISGEEEQNYFANLLFIVILLSRRSNFKGRFFENK